MPNNVLWLMHRPSGMAVQIGKRMGVGWYGAPEPDRLQELYDYVEQNFEPEQQDDFAVVIEDASGLDDPKALEVARYDSPQSVGRLRHLIVKERDPEHDYWLDRD